MALQKLITTLGGKLNKEVGLHKSEETYFDMISRSAPDLKELQENVPSVKIEGDTISIDDKDIDALDNYIDETVRLGKGQGARLPNRFHSGDLTKTLGAKRPLAKEAEDLKNMMDRIEALPKNKKPKGHERVTKGIKTRIKDIEAKIAAGVVVGAGSIIPKETEAAVLDQSKVDEALKQNVPISDIQNYLTDQGFNPLDVKQAVDSSLKNKINTAAEQGIEPDAIKSYMVDNLGMDPANADELLTGVEAKERVLDPEVERGVGEEFEAEETPLGFLEEGAFGSEAFETPEQPEFSPQKLVSMYESMGAKYSTVGKQLVGALGSADYEKEAFKDSGILASHIVAGLKRHGHDVEAVPNTQGLFPTYDIVIQTPEGPQIIDSDVMQSIGNSKYEIAGAISAASAALKAGGKGVPVAGVPGLLLKGALLVGGSALGAAVGSAVDLMELSKATREFDNITVSAIKNRMIDAGTADAIFGIIGTTAIKATVGTVKAIGRGMDLVFRGNLTGAHTALKDLVGLDDTQIDAIIKEFEKMTGKRAPGLTQKAKAIHVISQTTPGAEDVVGQAAQINPRVGANIIRSIHDRATNVIKAAKTLTNDNIGTVIKDDLEAYSGNVKDYYTGIKNHAIDAMEDSGYKFDYDELTLEPLFKKIEGNIQNPAVLERFQSQLDKVRALGQVIDGDGKVLTEFAPRMRSFEDLLDLRKVVNEFKHNKRISGHGNHEAINEVINNLNKEIKHAVGKHMDQSGTWLKEWKKANVEYSKMLNLKDNVMFKALTAKGVNVDKVINSLVKDIKSIDGTFMQVMSKLPPRTRVAAEGAVMKKLIANHTVGAEGGLQAIHFPSLQKSLEHVGFTSPETREMKRAVSELANVFRNDINIFRTTGQLSTEKFTSYLTFDPIVRLKFVVANKSFNYFRRLIPGAKGEAAALVSKAAKVLENPANAKAVEDIIKVLPNDPELASSIKQLSIEYAKFGFEEHYPKVKIFKSGVPGKSAKAIDGPLGKGIYWTTNKTNARARSKVTGGKVEARKILPARIATEEDIKRVIGREFEASELKSNPQIIEKLKNELYQGITIGEDMVIFK